MPSQYPLSIPFAKMSEKEGMLKFLLLDTNLLDYQDQDIFIFDEQIGTSSFALYKDKHLNLVFVHSSAETGTRKVSVDLNGLKINERIFVVLDWSKEQDFLCAADMFDFEDMRHAKALEQKQYKTPMPKVFVKGILTSVHVSKTSLAKVHMSNAKGQWDWNLINVQNVIDGLKSCAEEACTVRNPLFELAIVKQCIVMLVTGLEIYSRARFVEMERKGKNPDINALLANFDRKNRWQNDRDDYVRTTGNSVLMSLLEIPKGRGLINFQNYEDCKDAYNKGYGVRFGELSGIGTILVGIQSYIMLRHVIIHNQIEPAEPVIGYGPQGNPFYLDISFVEQAIYECSYFVDALHAATS